MERSSWSRERIASAVGVIVLHLLLGYAFVTGLAQRVAERVGDELRVFDVTVPPVPPPVEDERTPEPEGAAAPPALRADPVPVVAPTPVVPLPVPPPVTTAPVAREGTQASAGAADTPGPGTGAGGEGSGTGAGGAGTGTGGGGAARAQRISGQLENRDYPRAALRARAEGSVSVRYTVRADGRVAGCAVTRSSGNADLDATTCRLIERRFRYRPARDAAGQPTAETVTRTFDWSIPE